MLPDENIGCNFVVTKNKLMKQTLHFLTLSCALLIGISITAQNVRSLRADEVANPPVIASRSQGPALARTGPQQSVTAAGSCDSIRTTYAGGNGNIGIMFNVVAVQPLTITFFDGVFAGAAGWAYIYHKSGSYIGFETSAAAWTLVDSAYINSFVAATPRHIPIYVNRAMNTGDTAAFYISGDGNLSVDYTNGTSQNALYAQDLYLKVHEGRGMTSPLFNTSATPRVFNGNIYYCPPNSYPCQLTTTTFAGGNGNDGNMFDIVATTDVTINGFYGNIVGSGYVKIYYRNGTYQGNEANPVAWTYIDSALVTGTAGLPTLIPIPVNIPVPTGQTVAFYITGNASGAAVDYTDGTTEGAVFTYDGLITFLEGKGITYPFGTTYTPRIWNGMIDYCVGITGVESSNANLASVNVFPNPFNSTATFAIQTQQPVNNMQLSIYDASGRIVRQVNNINTPTVTIDREGLTGGMYFYMLTAENQLLTNGKLIIE